MFRAQKRRRIDDGYAHARAPTESKQQPPFPFTHLPASLCQLVLGFATYRELGLLLTVSNDMARAVAAVVASMTRADIDVALPVPPFLLDCGRLRHVSVRTSKRVIDDACSERFDLMAKIVANNSSSLRSITHPGAIDKDFNVANQLMWCSRLEYLEIPALPSLNWAVLVEFCPRVTELKLSGTASLPALADIATFPVLCRLTCTMDIEWQKLLQFSHMCKRLTHLSVTLDSDNSTIDMTGVAEGGLFENLIDLRIVFDGSDQPVARGMWRLPALRSCSFSEIVRGDGASFDVPNLQVIETSGEEVEEDFAWNMARASAELRHLRLYDDFGMERLHAALQERRWRNLEALEIGYMLFSDATLDLIRTVIGRLTRFTCNLGVVNNTWIAMEKFLIQFAAGLERLDITADMTDISTYLNDDTDVKRLPTIVQFPALQRLRLACLSPWLGKFMACMRTPVLDVANIHSEDQFDGKAMENWLESASKALRVLHWNGEMTALPWQGRQTTITMPTIEIFTWTDHNHEPIDFKTMVDFLQRLAATKHLGITFKSGSATVLAAVLSAAAVRGLMPNLQTCDLRQSFASFAIPWTLARLCLKTWPLLDYCRCAIDSPKQLAQCFPTRASVFDENLPNVKDDFWCKYNW